MPWRLVTADTTLASLAGSSSGAALWPVAEHEQHAPLAAQEAGARHSGRGGVERHRRAPWGLRLVAQRLVLRAALRLPPRCRRSTTACCCPPVRVTVLDAFESDSGLISGRLRLPSAQRVLQSLGLAEAWQQWLATAGQQRQQRRQTLPQQHLVSIEGLRAVLLRSQLLSPVVITTPIPPHHSTIWVRPTLVASPSLRGRTEQQG